jgi:hypothetical protein
MSNGRRPAPHATHGRVRALAEDIAERKVGVGYTACAFAAIRRRAAAAGPAPHSRRRTRALRAWRLGGGGSGGGSSSGGQVDRWVPHRAWRGWAVGRQRGRARRPAHRVRAQAQDGRARCPRRAVIVAIAVCELALGRGRDDGRVPAQLGQRRARRGGIIGHGQRECEGDRIAAAHPFNSVSDPINPRGALGPGSRPRAAVAHVT